MTPLPENNTAVFFLDYTTCQEGHTLQCRYTDAATVADAMTSVDAFLTALGNSHRIWNITGARNRAEGAVVSTDVVWTGSATYGTGGGTHYESSQFYDFVGRSLGGRRVRAAIFGATTLNDTADFRIPEDFDVAFSGALAVLDASADTFVAIDGQQATWKRYVNLGQNAYWRNHIRA